MRCARTNRVVMNILSKKIFPLIFCAALCSCAGTKTQGLVRVPGQDVSFIAPPSNWETNQFASTSQTPPGGFLPMKQFSGRWTKRNLSTIRITGFNISGITTAGETRTGMIAILDEELAEFKKVCGFVKSAITQEAQGALRNGIDYTAIEAEVECVVAEPYEPLKAKIILYVLESMGYVYTIQYKAVDQFYESDKQTFDRILKSIRFGSQ